MKINFMNKDGEGGSFNKLLTVLKIFSFHEFLQTAKQDFDKLANYEIVLL